MTAPRDPLPDESWTRDGITRRVVSSGERVRFSVVVGSRAEEHEVSRATWLLWARRATARVHSNSPQQGELFA